MGFAVEDKEHNVGHRAGAETAVHGELHGGTEFALFVLLLVKIDGDGGVAAIGSAAAAALGADEEMSPLLSQVNQFAVHAQDASTVLAHTIKRGLSAEFRPS